MPIIKLETNLDKLKYEEESNVLFPSSNKKDKIGETRYVPSNEEFSKRSIKGENIDVSDVETSFPFKNSGQRKSADKTSFNDDIEGKKQNLPGLYTQVEVETTARTSDAVRLSKFIASPKGVLFAAKQALLLVGNRDNVDSGTDLSVKDRLENLGANLKEGVKEKTTETANTAARIANIVAQGASSVPGFRISSNPFGRYLDNVGTDTEGFLNTVTEGIGNLFKQDAGTLTLRGQTVSVGNVNSSLLGENRDQIIQSGSSTSPQDDYIRKEVTLKTSPKWKSSTWQNRGGTEKILNYTYETVNDNNKVLLKFQPYLPFVDDVDTIAFTAHLDSLTDNHSANWNSTNYIGRGETLYNYQSSNRSVSFSFKAISMNRNSLTDLYNRLNKLASYTNPTYSATFMAGTFVTLTLGDYFKNTPGVLTSIQFTWQTSYPWEVGNIGKENLITNPENKEGQDLPYLPHMLDVSVGFNVIHNFLPTANGINVTKQYINTEVTQAST